MKIAVFGLGYVGVVNMACFSRLGHTVWGCDIKSQKVDSIRNGKSPIFEPEVDAMLAEGLAGGRVFASTDAAEVIDQTDVALICVGTPSMADGTVNLDYTVNTTQEIARHLSKSSKPYHLIFRSTIPPGTIEQLVLPELNKTLEGDKTKVRVAFLPEFLREGSAVKDFFNCSRIVIGSANGEDETLKTLLSYDKKIPLVFTNYRTAEFVKYVDNAFHAMKIAFVNEAYAIGAAHGVDITAANRIFLMDHHLNISETYLRPGLPFGGSCLPKDMRAINHLARKEGLSVPVMEGILQSNTLLLERMVSRILQTGAVRFALYGLTFKSGTDDVRESPMIFLAKRLSAAGVSLSVYDPDINLTNLRIEQADIVKHIAEEPASAFGNAEVVIVCKKGFSAHLAHLSADCRILNFFNQETFDVSNPQELLY